MSSRRGILLLLLMSFLPAAAGAGPEPLPVTLHEAAILALERSPDLLVERFRVRALEPGVAAAEGEFDPRLALGYSHGESEAPTSARQSALETAAIPVRRARDDQATAALSQRFPTGTEVELSARTARTRSNFSAEEFSSGWELGVTQPLLRGLGSAVNGIRVARAQNALVRGHYALENAINETLAGVELAYWNLAAALRAGEVQERSLDLARRLLAETQARVDAGKLGRVELAAARAEVAAREEAVQDGRALAARSRIDLLRWVVGGGLGWDSPLAPATEPQVPMDAATFEPAVRDALQWRPDLAQARLELADGELAVLETRDGLLPRLDFFVTYGQTGLDTTFGGAWDSAAADGHEDWRVGLNFETSLTFRGERAENLRARFDRSAAEAALRNLEHLIESQVRKAVLEVDRLQRKLPLAQVTVGAREAEVAAEQARYRAGRTTATDVLQAENRLREAELNALRTETDLLKAWVELARVEGSVFRRWNVEVR